MAKLKERYQQALERLIKNGKPGARASIESDPEGGAAYHLCQGEDGAWSVELEQWSAYPPQKSRRKSQLATALFNDALKNEWI